MGMLEQFLDRTDQFGYSDAVQTEETEKGTPTPKCLRYPFLTGFAIERFWKFSMGR